MIKLNTYSDIKIYWNKIKIDGNDVFGRWINVTHLHAEPTYKFIIQPGLNILNTNNIPINILYSWCNEVSKYSAIEWYNMCKKGYELHLKHIDKIKTMNEIRNANRKVEHAIALLDNDFDYMGFCRACFDRGLYVKRESNGKYFNIYKMTDTSTANHIRYYASIKVRILVNEKYTNAMVDKCYHEFMTHANKMNAKFLK